MGEDRDPVERFLSQPAEAVASDEDRPVPRRAPRRSARAWLRHLLFEGRPGAYSSIMPRRADGKRAGPFFFNGNGRGR